METKIHRNALKWFINNSEYNTKHQNLSLHSILDYKANNPKQRNKKEKLRKYKPEMVSKKEWRNGRHKYMR